MTGHKKHVAKLEQIVRLMDNDLLQPEDIDEVSELTGRVEMCVPPCAFND